MVSPREIEVVIRSAFADVKCPGRAEIAPHQCLECDEISSELDGQSWLTIEEQLLDRHVWDLPLLSDDAKKYFLPAWLIRSLADPGSDYAQALTYALTSDHRWSPSEPYSLAQWAAIRSTLEYLEESVDEFSKPEVVAALRFVSTRPN